MTYQEHAAPRVVRITPANPAPHRQDKPDSSKIERKLKADVEAWLRERRASRPFPSR